MRRRGEGAGITSATITEEPEEVSERTESDGVKATSSESSNGGLFECNICFDTPQDPVVTRCGHLYCWSCLWRWMRQRAGGASQCPVCKASVTRDTVTPIYGRGRAQGEDPRAGSSPPPRPAGQRVAPNAHPGIHPYWHQAAAFGRNAYGGAHGNLALATFGNFPSLFGMEIAYPQLNEQNNDTPRLTPEQETREQVAKVFLFLALFIIVIITLF